jgi:DNA-binding transcriptional LysR family regulator
MKWDDRIGRRLRLKDFHTLQTVAEAGSMAKASERLALSQPAISKAISDMERVLGAPLLERSSRGVALTACGRLVIEHSRVIFDEIRQSVSGIEHLSDPASGLIRIGTTEPVMGVVAEIINEVSRKYPRISYEVTVGETDALVRELRERAFDVVLTRWAPASAADDLAVQVLFKSPFVAMVERHHPLLRRKTLNLGDLLEEQWTFSPPDTFAGRIMVDLFRRRKLPFPTTVVTSNSVFMRLSLVASGRFLTVLPAQVLRYRSNSTWLRALDIDLGDSSQPTASITSKKRRSGGALVLFRQISLEVCKAMVGPQ